MREYRVRVTPRFSIVVWADNIREAKEAAWMDIESGYTYGYDTKAEFLKKAKVELMSKPG